jgi:hypothetical protein
MAAATRQIRRPRATTTTTNGTAGSGLGVDRFGAPVIDPTENVLALVDAESRRQDGLRDAETRYQNAMRLAETKRIDDLAQLRSKNDEQISAILTTQVKTTSELISTQLDKVTTSLSNQITTLTKATQDQIAALTKSFNDQLTAVSSPLNERLNRVEQFRYEYAGRASVSDPATSQALETLTKAVVNLRASEDTTKGHVGGRSEMIAWMFAAGMFFVAVATAIVTAIHH